jgi:hypothetical protein
MAKVKSHQKAEDTVTFITGKPAFSGVRLDRASAPQALTKKISDVKEDWVVAMKQISVIVSNTDAEMKESGFELDQIEVSLGFSASGKIGFIAEAGIEASISVTFTKNKTE